MSRDTPITVYVEEDEAEALRREADRQDKTLSTHVYDLTMAERDRTTTDKRLRELSVEERIEGLIADTKDVQARAATYQLVNFRVLTRLFGNELPEAWISDQFEWASAKLCDDDVTPGELEDADEPETGNVFDDLQ